MPAWVAKPLAHAVIEMGMPVHRNNARIVYRLSENRYILRRLHDLITVAGVRRNTRQRITYDTARFHIEVLSPIKGTRGVPAPRFIPPDLSLLAIRCEGRLSSVRRVIT